MTDHRFEMAHLSQAMQSLINTTLEKAAGAAAIWQGRWAEDNKRFDDQFWEAGAAVAEQIQSDIRQLMEGE